MTDKISSGSVEDAIDVEAEKVQFYSDVAPMESKSRCSRWLEKLGTFGVETRGICPVPEEERTDPQYSKALFVWLSYNLSILAFSLGTLGPIVNGLSFKTSAGVIVGFVTLAGLPPAYLATFGPKLGLRQMVQARFSFGYYGAIVPGSLEVLGMIGYSVINVILGGKILSAVSGGSLSWNVGIVVVSAGGLVISFFGGRVLTLYARVAWIPMLVVFTALIAVGAKNLSSASFVPASTPETHKGVLGFGSSIAAYTLSYSPAMSDYTNYMRPGVDSRKIFAFAHLSLVLPSVSVAMLGAAFGASLKSNPTWQAGYDAAGPGGLIAAVLEPLGGFGKFLTVLLGLSVITNLGPNMYSFCFSFQVVVPPASRVPRYVFSIMGILVLVPLAIVGAKRFETTLVGFLGIVGYWCSTFVSVLIVEHVYFRRATFSNYDVSSWEAPRALPPGIAALGACTLTFGLIALCMSKAWYTGIIAKHTGDLGLEVGLILAGLLYVPLRTLEKRMVGR